MNTIFSSKQALARSGGLRRGQMFAERRRI